MEEWVRDLALRTAGLLGILVAIAHGVIAEVYVFVRSRVEPQSTRRLLRLIWQASTIDWIAVGVLLIVAPVLGSELARRWIIGLATVVFGYAAVANAVATKGQHYGWWIAASVVALALLGI
jgi:hypothetical protein